MVARSFPFAGCHSFHGGRYGDHVGSRRPIVGARPHVLRSGGIGYRAVCHQQGKEYFLVGLIRSAIEKIMFHSKEAKPKKTGGMTVRVLFTNLR